MRRAFLVYTVLVGLACSSTSDDSYVQTGTVFVPDGDVDADSRAADAAGELSEPTSYWPGESPQPPWSPWFAQYPWIAEEFSRWSFQVEGDGDPPHFRYLPDHAVGNGHVFTLLGTTFPLNTLHSMNGPYYHKGERFFTDVWLELASGANGAPIAWTKEGSGKLTSMPLVITWAVASKATLLTVDFAPQVGTEENPVRRALVRFAIIHNPGTTAISGLELRLRAAGPQTFEGAAMLEQVESRTRSISVLEEEGVEIVDGHLRLSLGEIPAGGDRVVPIAIVFDDEQGMGGETVNGLAHVGLEVLLEQTRIAWQEKLSGATRLTTPDPRVNDYLASQLLVVLSQQAYNGSSHPMCEYTGTWLRDNAGPVRLLTRVGLFEEVRAQLDYLHLATLAKGSIANSYFGNFQPEDAGPEPDWAAMSVMTGRSRAESPSYIPLMFSWYREASGKEDFIEEYFEWMRFALEGQLFDGDLLPFSTDETFRTAMAVAHGLAIDEQFETGFYSANSSFLWVAAAERLAEMAEVIGREAAAQSLRTKAADVRANADATFLSADGYYHPYVYSEDLEPAPAPFEDVNTKPIWSGYLLPDDPVALSNLKQTIELLGSDDGFLVSPLPEAHQNMFGLPIAEGIHTGMSPGYFLDNLARTQHPLGEAAFNALAVHATASGTTPEYQILDDHAPLHFIYDSSGGIGDYTARYRPWEGGLLADAAWSYLLGNRFEAAANTLHLAPHLPNGWSWMEATGIRVGEARLNFRLERKYDVWRAIAGDLEGLDVLKISLTVPSAQELVHCSIDDRPVSCTPYDSPWAGGDPLQVISFDVVAE